MPLDKPKPHEDLLRFSRRHGVAASEIQRHPDNADALAPRQHHTLHEHDEIFVPEEESLRTTVESGKTHVLVYAPAERVLHLTLRDDDGQPLNGDYTLKDIEYDETATGDEPSEIPGYAHQGLVHHILPAATQTVTLVMDGQEDFPVTLEVARLDPVSRRSGLLARLALLGFYAGPLDDFSGHAADAIRHFQLDQGLPATGQADPETRATLVRRVGA